MKNTRATTRRETVFVVTPTKRGKGSVGEGETGKKAKATPDEGGKSVSKKVSGHHQKKMLIINLKLISGKYAQKNEISG